MLKVVTCRVLRILVLAFLFLPSADDAKAAIVNWDGEGGDFSWQNRTNWAGDTLPGTADTVIIDAGPSTVVVSSANVTISTLGCSNDLRIVGGVFRITSGSSVVQGGLTSLGNPRLSAAGPGTSFSVAGLVSVDGLSLETTGGAAVRLPRLASYAKGTGCGTVNWDASGPGSLLDLPGLAKLTGAACANLNLQALSGGTIVAANLTTVTEGSLLMLADGTNSRIDLSGLTSCPATARSVIFQARNSGAISIPLLPGGVSVSVSLASGGILPVAQLRQLAGLNVSGMEVEFPALTNLNMGDITVDAGGQLRLPKLTSHTESSDCRANTWLAKGPGSRLDLSHLTKLSGPGCGFMNIQATGGGNLDLGSLPSVTEGTINFLAEGSGSLLDLTSVTGAAKATRIVTFTARNGGNLLAPALAGGPTVGVSVENGGLLSLDHLGQISALSVKGTNAILQALTNLMRGDLALEAGAIVSLPNLKSYSPPGGCRGDSWRVRGNGSRLEFPALTSLVGPPCGYLNIQAVEGGVVDLGRLTDFAEGTVDLLADGPGSQIDLSALVRCRATARSVSLRALHGARIEAPLLTGGSMVSVAIDSTSTLPLALLSELSGLSVSGGRADFPALTNLTFGDLTVGAGAVVTLPLLTRHHPLGDCYEAVWQVSGIGSVLDLSGLTSLNGARCGVLRLEAVAGAMLTLSNLTSVTEGLVQFRAQGPDSLTDLAGLAHCEAPTRQVFFEAQDGGTLWIPKLDGGPSASISVVSNGVMPLAQVTQINGINVSAAKVDLPSLTRFDHGSLSATNGGTITASTLASYSQGASCAPSTWVVSGPGASASFPMLTELHGGQCTWLDAQALKSGKLLLGALGTIPSGQVRLLVSGTGSLIDLHSLSNFLNPEGLSSLVATNNGTLLLPDGPCLFSGVRLEINANADGTAPVLFKASNMVLHAAPWRSYCVQSRATAAMDAGWLTYGRVPLTESFQLVGPRARAGLQFMVQEFVANPYALDFELLGQTEARLILYSPTGRAFDIARAQTIDGLPAWETVASVTMTNTFRILPQVIDTTDHFYKALPR